MLKQPNHQLSVVFGIAVLVFGVVIGVTTQSPDVGVGAICLATGASHLIVAALLAKRLLLPSDTWGHSATAMATQAVALLGMSMLFLTGEFGPRPWSFFIAATPAAVLILGASLERRARKQADAADAS